MNMLQGVYTLVLEFDGVCYCNQWQGALIPDLVDSFDSPAEVGQGLSDWCGEYAPSRFRVEVAGEPASDLELAVIAAAYEHNWGKPWRPPEAAS
jgi:hypothetical protein